MPKPNPSLKPIPARATASTLASALALSGACALVALTATGSAHAGGVVQVNFVAPEQFADAGERGRDRDANLQRLAAHLQQLGASGLADGQTLRIDVLDVDLAGRTKHLGSRGDVRLLKGAADWPQMRLRYTLEAPGAAVQRGEDRVADLDYLGHRPAQRLDEPLPYEKAMLDAWFKRRFGSAAAH